MKNYPKTINNGHGEELTFLGREVRDGVEYLLVENCLQPGSGPPMHVHFKQDESLTVVDGVMAIHTQGEQPKYLKAGESATFHKGIAHRFWNAGDTLLRCKGTISPPDNIEYFLTEIYRSAQKGKDGRPATYESAFLMSRYKTEFGMQEIPTFVKKVIFPIILFLGKLRGLDKAFTNAPPAVR